MKETYRIVDVFKKFFGLDHLLRAAEDSFNDYLPFNWPSEMRHTQGYPLNCARLYRG